MLRVSITLIIGCLALLSLYLLMKGQQYYRDLNAVRLDPLGTNYFASDNQLIGQRDDSRDLAVIVGDSRATAWPLLESEPYHWINRGIDGQTSSQIIGRYHDDVLAHEPQLVIVQMCVNDLKTIPLFPEREAGIIEKCIHNIDQLVMWADEFDHQLILTTVFPVGEVPIQRRPVWSTAVAQSIEIVNEHMRSISGANVQLFDAFALLVGDNGLVDPNFAADELHLNAAGYEILNRELFKVIQADENE